MKCRPSRNSSRTHLPNSWHSLDPDMMASLYGTELAAILDRAIPARTVTRRSRTSDPWFDEECRTAKRLTRRLERAAAAAAKRSDATDAASANQAWQTRRAYHTPCFIKKRPPT